jgi:Kdo2-lipid IVA lauroyltransferase/acyltransferase
LVKIILFPVMFFSYLLRLLPLPWFGCLGRGLGNVLHLVGFRKKVVSGNLQLALGKEKSPKELKELEKKIYHHTGTLFLEILRNFTLTKQDYIDELEISPEDKATLDRIKNAGKGLLAISAHTANWEIFPASIASRGYPVAIVAKKMSSPVAQTLIEQRRATAGFNVIYTGNTLHTIAESLKKGVFVGCMVDQHMPGAKGIRVNFFGVPASSIRGMAKLARETRCIIYPIYTYRQPSGKHRLRILDEIHYIEAPEYAEGSEERILREEWLNTQRYQEAMEQMIREHLDQWLWIHRRWKADRTPIDFATAHLNKI